MAKFRRQRSLSLDGIGETQNSTFQDKSKARTIGLGSGFLNKRDVESTVRKFSKDGKKVTNHGYAVETQECLRYVASFDSTSSNFGLDSSSKSSETEDEFKLQDDTGDRKMSLPVMLKKDDPVDHKVIVIGPTGVGKSSLCQQFLTSENHDVYQSTYLNTNSFVSSEVFLELNGSKSKLTFIEMPGMSWLGLVHGDENAQKEVDSYEPSAFIAAYAVDDKPSFNKTSQVLAHLAISGYIHDKVVLLVATKSDLARARVVSTNAGKALAIKYGVKFIETSSGIGYNVDELLVGIVTQLQLKKEKLAASEICDFNVFNFLAKMKHTGQSGDTTDIMN